MKKITKYVANDGIEFDNESDCLEHDSLIVDVTHVMKSLKPVPKNDEGCRFANGHYFIQQDLNIIADVKHKLLLLIKKRIDHPWVENTLNDPTVHPSYVQRLVSENSDNRPLTLAWNRISNTDNLGREWGQGYYAKNPEESPALKQTS